MKHARWLIPCALFTGAILPFAAAWHFGLLNWDDDYFVTRNDLIRDLSWQNISRMFTDRTLSWRYVPLFYLSYASLFKAFGLNPAAFHGFNLIGHGLNAVLFFLLLKRLAGSSWQDRKPLALLFGCALMWATHPSRTEPVVWVMGLGYIQANFLLLVSAHLGLGLGSRFSNTRYALSLLAYLGSILTFGIAILQGPLFYFLFRFGSRLSVRRAGGLALPYCALGAVGLGLNLWIRAKPEGHFAGMGDVAGLDWTILTRSAYLLVRYASEPLLVFFRMVADTGFYFFDWKTPFHLLGMAAFPVICFLAWRGRHRYPYLSAGWMLFLLAQLPTVGLTERHYLPADRYTYLPWLIIFAAIALELAGRPVKRGFVPMVAASILVFASASMVQTRIWASDAAILGHIAETQSDPNSPYLNMIYGKIGGALLNRGEMEKAIEMVDLRFGQTPQRASELLAIRGVAKLNIGDFGGAEKDLSARRGEAGWGLHVPLAFSLIHLGRLEEARRVLAEAKDKGPAWQQAADKLESASRKKKINDGF
jgi:hypothetical protein